jgi:hypothetical protein
VSTICCCPHLTFRQSTTAFTLAIPNCITQFHPSLCRHNHPSQPTTQEQPHAPKKKQLVILPTHHFSPEGREGASKVEAKLEATFAHDAIAHLVTRPTRVCDGYDTVLTKISRTHLHKKREDLKGPPNAPST